MPTPKIIFEPPRYNFEHAGQTTILYFFQSGRFLKIGIAANVEKRLAALRCGNPHGIEIAAQVSVPKTLSFQIERKVHQALHAVRHAGEWFEVEVTEAVRIAETIIPAAFAKDAEWVEQFSGMPKGISLEERCRMAQEQRSEALVVAGKV